MIRYTLALALLACNTTPPSSVVIRAGRLWDGTGAPALLQQRLLIKNGEIVSITADDDSAVEPGALVVDAREHTVMPGLINAHVHLVSGGACEDGVGSGVSAAVRNLHALVAGGVTTVADLGAPVAATLGLRAFAGVGESDGPRVMVAGPILTAPKGYMTNILDGELVDVGMVREVATPAEARHVVQELAEQGVDLIKLGLQELHYDRTPLPLMSPEVVCAVVDEAHTQELRVVAHAVSPRSYQLALDCNVDAFAHGLLEPLPQDILEQLAQRQIPVAPTLFVFHSLVWGPEHAAYYESKAVSAGLDDASLQTIKRYIARYNKGGEHLPSEMMPNVSREKAILAGQHNATNTQAMHTHKVPLAMGTDGGICMNPMGSPVQELLDLQAAGLTPPQVLHAATMGSARLLGLGDALGRLTPGFRADVIVVKGKPDEHLEDVVNVQRVFIDGREQTLLAPSFWDTLQAGTRIGWTLLRR